MPIANPVTIDRKCDDDADGKFPFETSFIESTVVGSQTNVAISYFDEMGNALPSPLPNPFLTNSQTISIRVVNSATQAPDGPCYDETFLTSNISPQNHSFNAGIWNRLEQKTRFWAEKYDKLYIVTGGILNNNLKTIGFEKVGVPNYFYKIILDYHTPKLKVIAFLIPHQNSEKGLCQFVTSVDEIERLTGIDFFPELPDELETELEKSDSYINWSFN